MTNFNQAYNAKQLMKQSKQVRFIINVTGLFSIRSDTHRANVSGSGWSVLGSVGRVVSWLPALRWCVRVIVVGQHMLLPCSLFSCCCNSNVTLPSGWLTSWSQSREMELTGCRVPATPRSDQIWTVKVTSLSPCCTILHPYIYIYQNDNSIT